MAIRKIAVMGHPILRQEAKPIPVKEITQPQFQSLLKDMTDTMFEYDGLGLAAPQIHESWQALVMIWDFDPGVKAKLLYLINPVVKSLTTEESSNWEGCLSVPGLRGDVSRPNKVSVEAYDHNGKKISFEAEGFAATVIQHECDHLKGILYVDKVKDGKLAFIKEYQKFWANSDDESQEEGE